MYIINYKLFADNLNIDTIGGDFVPINSPVIIHFTLQNDHSRHSILKEFCRHLKMNYIHWIQPYNNINEEWIIDLTGLKRSFTFLSKENYLQGKITLDPIYDKKEEYDELKGKSIVKETIIKFKIDPKELFIYFTDGMSGYPSNIEDSLQKFKGDYGDKEKCAFLMMKYEDSALQSRIVQRLKNIFYNNGLYLLRADDKHYSDDLLSNIRTYMHGCNFGVAIFERINSDDFNPNVSLEVGYMMALNKSIMFLKDSTLKSLHTDLVAKLYEEFDFQKLTKSFDDSVIKWLKNNDLIL
jgi:hypothetical protein